MEIYSDPPSKTTIAQKLAQTQAARTPLVDVQNLAHSRFDCHATPKRHVGSSQLRRSKVVSPTAHKSSSSEFVIKEISSSAESVLAGRRHSLDNLDVGAEIFVDDRDESREDAAVPLNFVDCGRAGQRDQQDFAETLDASICSKVEERNLPHCDHTYPTSGNSDTAKDLLETDKLVGPETELFCRNSTECAAAHITSSESVTRDISNPGESAMSSRLHSLGDLDVGAEIFVDNGGESRKNHAVTLTLDSLDCGREGQSVEQTHQDLAEELDSCCEVEEKNLPHCDHTYPFSGISDTAEYTQGIDDLVRQDAEPLSCDSIVSDCVIRPDACLNNITTEDGGVGNDVSQFPLKVSRKDVGADGTPADVTSGNGVSRATDDTLTSEPSVLAESDCVSQETLTETDAKYTIDVSTVLEDAISSDCCVLVMPECESHETMTECEPVNTVDVSMVTEGAFTSDCSVLVVPECTSQETMTECKPVNTVDVSMVTEGAVTSDCSVLILPECASQEAMTECEPVKTVDVSTVTSDCSVLVVPECTSLETVTESNPVNTVDVSMVTEGAVTSDCSVLVVPECTSQETMTEYEPVNTVDVSMVTEGAVTSDCSVLVVPECTSQETMTESDPVNTVDVSMVTEGAVTSDCSVLVVPECTSQETMTESDPVNTVDVSMVTEGAVTSDCSVLVVPECTSQETMTESDPVNTVDVSMVTEDADCLNQETMTEIDVINTASSMTPFKQAKNGSRITAEEVRRQHPRVVANQIDTVMLANQRLEKQAKSFEREKTLLKSALKESKSALQEREATITELRTALEEQHQKQSQQEDALLEERMKCWNAEQTLQSSTSELQQKCQDLERLRLETELSFAEELERVHVEAKQNSYKGQFESAQQKIRELQAVKQEYTQIAGDVEKALALQDHLHVALVQLKAAANGLARDKAQLRNENDSFRKRCMSTQVDLDVLRFINQELLSDNEKIKELVSSSDQCIAELEKSLKTANTVISRLQNELAERSAENTALTEAKEELRREKALMIIQLSEQQDSETVALQALEEAERELQKMEEALAKERGVLAAGKEMHERMQMDYEEKNLKLEMEVQHLEQLLDKSELKRDAQEQELFECQDQLYTLQDEKAMYEATLLEVDSGSAALQDLQEQMEAVLDTLQRKIEYYGSSFKSPALKSSTPKQNKKDSRRSFVAELLWKSGQCQQAAPHSSHKTRAVISTQVDIPHLLSLVGTCPDRQHRQQSNVEFGASCEESGAAAASLLSPHSHSFCGIPTNPQDVGLPGSSRKSVSFREPPTTRRELFTGSSVEDQVLPDKGCKPAPISSCMSGMTEHGHNTMPGFATIRSIPLASAGSRVAELDHVEEGDNASSGKSDGKSSSGKVLSMRSSSLSEKVEDLVRLLSRITKAIQLVERASHLSIKDGQDQLNFVKEQLKQETNLRRDLQSELEKKSESFDLVNSRQKELQGRVSEMTKSLLNFHDQAWQISRLEEEKRDMKWKIADLEGQCSLLSDHLEAVVKKLDAAMTGQSAHDGIHGQEVLALKKEKHELMMKLFAERDQHRDLGDKAVQRMKVLEGNWKKAENEVHRLDELIENVREGCVSSQAQTTHPLILEIVRLIDGKVSTLNSSDNL